MANMSCDWKASWTFFNSVSCNLRVKLYACVTVLASPMILVLGLGLGSGTVEVAVVPMSCVVRR